MRTGEVAATASLSLILFLLVQYSRLPFQVSFGRTYLWYSGSWERRLRT